MPTVTVQRAKFIVQYIGIYVTVNVLQVGTILFEQDQQVRVVTYQMFRYPRVRLTEIEAINVRVATHRKVFSYCILSHAMSSKIKIEFGRASVERCRYCWKT